MNGKRQAEWRRDQVLELTSKGHTQSEISNILQVSISTISRDLSSLRKEAKIHVKKYIDERLPEEYEKCLVGLTAILREAWNTSQQSKDNREKIQALSLAKECYSMKMDLLTNATVLDDAINFVQINKVKSIMSKKEDSKESKEPNSNEDKEEPEEASTTNKVF